VGETEIKSHLPNRLTLSSLHVLVINHISIIVMQKLITLSMALKTA